MTLEHIKNEQGELPAYVWPGGYPILYYDTDCCALCAKCATKAMNDPDELERFKPVAYDVYYEGPSVYCEQCNTEIESAYGDPEEEGRTT